ncbi:MAG: hypothetical protein HYX76_06615, partial [Acidobacteria bacterium]|nr:hypothetical protein [Acidobacteriota bacterium]
ILDPRIQTKGYGRRFLESLPPAPITSELDAIEHFFQLCPNVIADSAQARER